MISGKEIYDISITIVPLYVATFLGYGSIRWWKIFTLDQCSGINRFVGVFAVPLLSFHYISSNDPYVINFRFIAADTLQKVVILVGLFLWHFFSKNGNIEWIITLFSLSFPNTLVMGIPLLNSMYGDLSQSLVVQIVILQSLVWYTIILFLYEYRGAKLLISEQFPENARTITSFRIDSDVFSLDRRDFLETDVEIGDDGKLHVTVRRSTSSSCNKSHVLITPRPSNFSSVEIYSVRSSQVGTPRVSNVSQNDFSIMLSSKLASSTHMHTNSFGGLEVFSVQSSKEQSTPRTSNFDQDEMGNRKRLGMSMSEEFLKNGSLVSLYPPPRPMSKSVQPKRKEIGDHSSGDTPKPVLQQEIVVAPRENASSVREMSGDHKEIDMSKFVANEGGDDENKHQMPPERVTARLTLIMVWRKLIRNPNTYATILGVIWSLVSFRWNIKMPSIVGESISILSDTGLGMAMFSLGLFMGLQPKIIACGRRLAIISIIVRFIIGPAVMAGTSATIGIHAVYLQISIIQAALPQGIVPFVFAKEYNVHADILSTAVSFGMLMALPLTIMYYVLLGL